MSDDALVFYTNPQSRGQITRWMLEEIGQPYRTEVLGYGATMKSPNDQNADAAVWTRKYSTESFCQRA